MSEQLQNTILFSQQAIDFTAGGSILGQVVDFEAGGRFWGRCVDFRASDFDFEAVAHSHNRSRGKIALNNQSLRILVRVLSTGHISTHVQVLSK
jgi:hypothetical protein